MIDCTKYSKRAFLQLLKGNPKYQQIISSAYNWENVVLTIDSLGLNYTEEQINYVKEKQWTK